jgi:CPA2 family monovalent cation:H+ antiporter-2
MIQVGEFSYLLAREGMEVGAVSATLNNLILTSSVLTIVLTPPAFALAPKLDRLLARLPAVGTVFAVRPLVWGKETELHDHVVVVGYGRVGRHLVDGLRRNGVPVAVIEQDLHLVQELISEAVPAIYGDASHPSILAAGHPERARLVAVALPDSGATRAAVHNVRRANPDVPILARMPREDDEHDLSRAGATALVAPERAGAMLMLEECERALDIPESSADITWRSADPTRAR